MSKAIRRSDEKVFDYVLFNGENLEKARQLFKATNSRVFEVIVCKTESGSLEMRVFDHNYQRSIFAAVDSYIVNVGGMPEVYETGPFFRLYTTFLSPKTKTEVEAAESQTKPLWDNLNNTLHIRDAFNIHFNNGKQFQGTNSSVGNYCYNGNCGKCSKNNLGATEFRITSDFDEKAFQEFLGKSIPFSATYKVTSAGRSFEKVTIVAGALFGTEMVPGSTLVRISDGRLAHVPNYTSPF